jgi:hypothetical protein
MILNTNEKRMRVSLLNINRDYSNVGAVFAKCLQSVGVDAESFEYCSPERVKIEVATSDVILWMQSIPSGMVTPLKSKKVAVFHGGSLYRLKSAKMNKYWNPIVDVTLTQTAEMLGRGAKNEKWMLPAAYIENITPRYTINKKLVVGHYPSIVYKKGRVDYELKGTRLINTILKDYDVEYRFSTEKLKWEDYLHKLSECDVYVESLSQASESNNKHDWSVSALEAASCGCITITNFGFGESRYKKEYGSHALLVANTEKMLRHHIETLLGLPEKYLISLKKNSVNWVNTVHSIEATGNRLMEYLEI